MSTDRDVLSDRRGSRIEDFLRGGIVTNQYEDGWNAGVERVWPEVDRLRAENERLRNALADVVEGETAEEGTPQWYALRNARGELGHASDDQQAQGEAR